jgi:NAD(P)-dependent dehydrogenase (short-subunit alcohol dehydrogenase family)
MRYEGRVCLVTGSTGIAAASARRLSREGARIFVASRTEEHCRDLVAAINDGGGVADYHVADLSEDGAADRVFAAVAERFGRIDGVFNVAGGSGRRFGDGPTHEATPQGWDSTLDLNARTLFLSCRAAARQMLSQEPDEDGQRGAILNMGSVTSTSPSPNYFATHAYAAAKGAIAALTRTMASYYAPSRIRVNAVAPAVTRTPMAERVANDPEIVEFVTWKQPLVGGLLEPEHIAGAAAFLLSRDAVAITGQVLDIDAGWSVTDAPWRGPA